MAVCVAEGHSVVKNSEQSVSAHSGPWQFSKPSRSWLLEALQLWKHTRWQSGVNDPTVPTLVAVLNMVANSVQSGTRSVSTRPAKQMALVRGTTSLRVNQLMDVVTPMGGGGGGGGGAAGGVGGVVGGIGGSSKGGGSMSGGGLMVEMQEVCHTDWLVAAVGGQQTPALCRCAAFWLQAAAQKTRARQ